MIAWLRRWWHEGDGHREPLLQAEAELRAAIAERTFLASQERDKALNAKERIGRLTDTLDDAIRTVKRGEANGNDS